MSPASFPTDVVTLPVPGNEEFVKGWERRQVEKRDKIRERLGARYEFVQGMDIGKEHV
jgi:hypothetical protein